ncbi:MAG: SBBP repeat-containing protein [Holophagales bacterium]|nr:MAG: SBBP repeat-containing protein [Holophagales bacterium]
MNTQNQPPTTQSLKAATILGALLLSPFAAATADQQQFLGMLGGSGHDMVDAVLTDASGFLYVVGSTTSSDFPVANAQQATLAGASDVFVTKLDPSGTSLIFSTYLGGSGIDTASALALDARGNLWIAGTTSSPSFPVTASTYDATCGTDGNCNNGASDAFLAAFNPAGQLIVSTFFGGSAADQANGVVIDAAGMVTLVGSTSSPDLPLFAPTQRSLRGPSDAMVARFAVETGKNALGLTFATYHGGRGEESVAGAALTSSGVLAMVGTTRSPDFPGVLPLVKSGLRGTDDAFVAAWALSDRRVVFSSYLGGDRVDYAQSVAAAGTDIVVAGQTWSTDFPLAAPLQATRRGPSDAFLVRLNLTQPALVFSSLFGGNGAETGQSVAIDASGDVLLAGSTSSSDLPVSPNAGQSGFGGGSSDSYVLRTSANGQALLYASYLGGSQTDLATASASNLAGGWVIAGEIELEPAPESLGLCDGYLALIGPSTNLRR